eukprot:7386115-Prymnesium_polylepis.1
MWLSRSSCQHHRLCRWCPPPSPCGMVSYSLPPCTRQGHRAPVARPARTGSPTRPSPSRATRTAYSAGGRTSPTWDRWTTSST